MPSFTLEQVRAATPFQINDAVWNLIPSVIQTEFERTNYADVQAAREGLRLLIDSQSESRLSASGLFDPLNILNRALLQDRSQLVATTLPISLREHIYALLNPTPASTINLPQGIEGARIFAARVVAFSADRYNWQPNFEANEVQQVERFLTIARQVRLQVFQQKPFTTSLEDYLLAFSAAVNPLDISDVNAKRQLELLIRVETDPSFAQAVREYTRLNAERLYSENPRLLDLLYLASHPLDRNPATTVSADQLKYVIVADKGEMGVRITREALDAGFIPVVLYNKTDDANALQVRIAKERGAITIGLDGDFKNSYANPQQITSVVRAEFQHQFGDRWREALALSALHPGYGPLAENEEAIAYFRDHGINFIGPMQDVVSDLGDKRAFRRLIQEIAPDMVTPGISIDSTNDPKEIERVIREAYAQGKFTFPGRLKAANGGGGRGQVVVERLEDLEKAIQTVQMAIDANGWTPGVQFEQNIPDTTHLEAQVVCDRFGNVRIFGMRDCTEQRRGQKIQEEAPPALLKNYPDILSRITPVIEAAMSRVGYVGAGTVELMFKDGKIYFLEVNTRIQVEHPVTEESLVIVRPDGTREPLNLIKLMMKIANGEAIDFKPEQIQKAYVSREFRINAESWQPQVKDAGDKQLGTFFPNGGKFTQFSVPTAAQVKQRLVEQGIDTSRIRDLKIRMDSGFEVEDLLVNKDPTFAKLIVSVDAVDSDEEYELLRLVSIAALELTNIQGDRMINATQAATGPDGKPLPFETNLKDHIQILNTEMMIRHSRGDSSQRHVNWVMGALRHGENLDETTHVRVRPSSSEYSLPIVYTQQAYRAGEFKDIQDLFYNPREFPVNPLTEILRPKQGSYQRIERLFGDQWSQPEMRIGVTLDPDNAPLHATLFRDNEPVAIVVSLHKLGINKVVRIELNRQINQLVGKAVNLTDNTEVEFQLPAQSNGEFLVQGSTPIIPGIGIPLNFNFVFNNGHSHLQISEPSGNRIANIRPHMALGHLNQYESLLDRLNDPHLTPKQRDEVIQDFRELIVEMAQMAAPETKTRTEFLNALAKAPYSLMTEVANLAIYENAEDEKLQRQVRGFADQVLFLCYYHNRYHKVTGFDGQTRGEYVVGVGRFDDRHDDQTVTYFKPESNRHVAFVKLERTQDPTEHFKSALQEALVKLNSTSNNLPQDVIEIMLPQHLENDDAFAAFASEAIHEVLAGTSIRRVTLIGYQKAGNPNHLPGDSIFNFKFNAETNCYEETKPRHEHPMAAEQHERWRWQAFESTALDTGLPLVHATAVQARGNSSDTRLILDSELRDEPQFFTPSSQLVSHYVQARVKGADGLEAIASNLSVVGNGVPYDLSDRLDVLLVWGASRLGLISHDHPISFAQLLESHSFTEEQAAQLIEYVSGFPISSLDIESSLASMAEAMGRLRKNNPKVNNNRIQLFVRDASQINEKYLDFMRWYNQDKYRGLDLEKIAIHALQGRHQIYTLAGNLQRPRLVSSLLAAGNSFIKPKTNLELRTNEIHRNNFTPAEQAKLLFDLGTPLKEWAVTENGVEEMDYDPSRKQSIRGLVGIVGGRPALFVVSDIVNPRKGLSFDAPDGELFQKLIEHSQIQGGMPLLVSEELSSGANLYNADSAWAGTTPLDQYGRSFHARYLHAAFSGRPNITIVNNLVVGGGIYGPKASHVLINGPLAAQALTGGKAAAYATGALPMLNERGELIPKGGTFDFDEKIDGNPAIHTRNGVTNRLVLSNVIEQLLNSGVAYQDLEKHLQPHEIRLLKQLLIEDARRGILFLDNNPSSLVGHPNSQPDYQDPHTILNDRGIEGISEIALKDAKGMPLVYDWNADFASEITTGWIVVNQLQSDGSLKPETLAVCLKNSEHTGPLSENAWRKIEEFAEVNARLGRKFHLGLDESDFAPAANESKVARYAREGATRLLNRTKEPTPLTENREIKDVLEMNNRVDVGTRIPSFSTEFESYINHETFAALAMTDPEQKKAAMKKLLEKYSGKPIPTFDSVLASISAQDKNGQPLFQIWEPNWADDLLTGWMVVPIDQADGTKKMELVAFMLNDPSGKNRGAITTEAARKAEEFLRMNSELGLPMVRFAGSPGFLANKQTEAAGIEQFGKRAMDQVIRYGHPMYTLEIFADSGGARIFMGSQTLGNHISTDAIDSVDANGHSKVPMAPLPPVAATGVLNAKELAQIQDDAIRHERFRELSAQKVISQSPQRAQQANAIRQVSAPVLAPQLIASGIKTARNQMVQQPSIWKPLALAPLQVMRRA